MIEVKASEKSKFQVGQLFTLELLSNWCAFVFIVNPNNWNDIKAELEKSFF